MWSTWGGLVVHGLEVGNHCLSLISAEAGLGRIEPDFFANNNPRWKFAISL